MLARAGAPLRRGLARVAGRMVARRGWQQLGFPRASDYARERAGISGRRLQELARMDRAFGEVPELARAFSRGELSWTKARLLARAATDVDARRWLELAARLTARELSREVRAVDARGRDLLCPETDEEGEDESTPKQTVFVHCTPAVRAKWHRARFLASREEGRPVPSWEVAEKIAAETLSAIPLDAEACARLEDGDSANGCVFHPPPEGIPDPSGAGSGPSASPCDVAGGPASTTARREGSAYRTANGCATGGAPEAPASSLPTVADAELDRHAWLLERIDDADPFDLELRLRRALDEERRLEAQMGPLLLAVATGRLYRTYGCPNLGAFAREWLGISPRKAEALVRLERAGQIAPALGDAYRAGRLSWPRAQLLVPLVQIAGSTPWHAAWVALAERITLRRLEDEVSRALALGRFEPPPLDPPAGSWDDGSAEELEPGEGSEAGEPAEPQTGAHPSVFPKTMSFFFTAPRDVALLFRVALATVQRRIERKHRRTSSESEALDAMLEHAFTTWGLANAELQREHRVFERDDWRCTFPGCTSYGNLQDHHIAYRSHGGSDALWNRTTLCVWHHLRGEHAKILRVRGSAPGRLRFELGLRPGRPPLARYRSGDVVME